MAEIILEGKVKISCYRPRWLRGSR